MRVRILEQAMSTRHKTCHECNGTGIDELDGNMTCWNCGGEGVVERISNKKVKLHKKGRRDERRLLLREAQ